MMASNCQSTCTEGEDFLYDEIEDCILRLFVEYGKPSYELPEIIYLLTGETPKDRNNVGKKEIEEIHEQRKMEGINLLQINQEEIIKRLKKMVKDDILQKEPKAYLLALLGISVRGPP